MAASARRQVIGSAKSSTPPNAAMTGTLSCRLAADIALRRGSAVYHAA